MGWPPEVGELLPHAKKAIGVREKLADYSLDPAHKVGGPKAQGFELILGITISELDHLEREIKTGILVTPIGRTRANPPFGINCMVAVQVRGIGAKDGRVAATKTVWEITGPDRPPRLVTAFLKP